MIVKESDLENSIIDVLKELGYEYIDTEKCIIQERDNCLTEPLLINRFSEYIKAKYQGISQDTLGKITRKLKDISRATMLIGNYNFTKFLSEGIKIYSNEEKKTKTYKVISSNIKENDYAVTNQFVISSIDDSMDRRMDVVVFVNGIPLVVMELKSPEVEDDEIMEKAFNQIGNCMRSVPNLFSYNVFSAISNGLTTRIGSITSNYERFSYWKSTGNTQYEDLDKTIKGLFKKDILVDLILNYVFYVEDNYGNKNKIVPGYHQYWGSKEAIKSLEKAKNGKGGIYWHTQGSGKSFSMIYIVKHMTMVKPKSTFLVVTDRNDLDSQLYETFQSARNYLNQKILSINTIKNLKETLKDVSQNGVYFSTVQKFSKDVKLLSKRDDIFIITDEAHRSHNNIETNWKLKENLIVDDVGNAARLREAFPEATFIGFTGTPIEKTDKSTSEIFGNVISQYNMGQAIEDNVVVPIKYESWKPEIEGKEKSLKGIDDYLEYIEGNDLKGVKLKGEILKKIKREGQKIEHFLSNPTRVESVVRDLLAHYSERKKILYGKALFVCFNRKIAIQYYKEIERQDPSLIKSVQVVMTMNRQTDSRDWQKIVGPLSNKEKAKSFKDKDSNFKIAIVVDMWSTGFDIPILDTLYLDKPLKGHNLMQTIARINRVYSAPKEGKVKTSGIIVDFIGIGKQLKQALTQYAGGKLDKKKLSEIYDISELKPAYIEKVNKIYRRFINPFVKIDINDFLNDKNKRFSIIKAVMEKIFINKDEDEFVKQTKEIRSLLNDVSTILNKNEKARFNILLAIRAIIINTSLGLIDLTKFKKEIIKRIEDAFENKGITHITDKNLNNRIDINKFIKSIQTGANDLSDSPYLTTKLTEEIIKAKIKQLKKSNLISSKKFSDSLKEILEKYNNNFMTIEELREALFELGAKLEEEEKENLSQGEKAFFDIINLPNLDKYGFDAKKIDEILAKLLDVINNDSKVNKQWIYNEAMRQSVRGDLKDILIRCNYPPKEIDVRTDQIVDQIMLQRNYKEN